MDWFLYDIGLRHERVNSRFFSQLSSVNFHFWKEDWTLGYACAHFKIFLKFYPFSSLNPLTANPTK